MDPEMGDAPPSAQYAADVAGRNHLGGADEDAKQATGRRVVRNWGKLFNTIRIVFHMAWIYLNGFIFGNFYLKFVYGTPTELNRRIAIVGDDFALGVGDWVTLGSAPGLQKRINTGLSGVVRRKSARLVRSAVQWSAIVAAKSGADTQSFVPRTQRNDPMKIGVNFEAFFDRNVGTEKYADIVVIMLGAHDKCEPEETASNIVAMCKELNRLAKHVVVCTIPLPPSLKNAPTKELALVGRNQCIKRAIANLQRDLDTDFRVTCADASNALVDPKHFSFGGRLLGGSGYRLVSEAVMTALVPMVDAVETRRLFVKKMQ